MLRNLNFRSDQSQSHASTQRQNHDRWDQNEDDSNRCVEMRCSLRSVASRAFTKSRLPDFTLGAPVCSCSKPQGASYFGVLDIIALQERSETPTRDASDYRSQVAQQMIRAPVRRDRAAADYGTSAQPSA
jgi:hypothetical protein